MTPIISLHYLVKQLVHALWLNRINMIVNLDSHPVAAGVQTEGTHQLHFIFEAPFGHQLLEALYHLIGTLDMAGTANANMYFFNFLLLNIVLIPVFF